MSKVWRGNGKEYDISFYAGGSIKTTTSQYLCVGMSPDTASVDKTAYLTDNGTALSDTLTAYSVIGVNQTYMSSGTQECQVRMMGMSAVKCASSISAGAFIMAYSGISTTTFAGHVEAVPANGSSISVATASVTTHNVILGRALEDASTNSVITAFLNPQMYDRNLITVV